MTGLIQSSFLLLAMLSLAFDCSAQTTELPSSRLPVKQIGLDRANALTQLSPEELSQGWLTLFDNISDFGWHPMNNANWKFLDGEIRVDQGDVGLLRTSAQFDDFELRLEVKADHRTNSGVFFRTSPRPTDPAGDCFEFNIANRLDSPFPTGSLVGRVACKQDFDVSGWTKVYIRADGNRIQAWINDEQTCDYLAPLGKELGRGYIGLQYNSGMVAFRNIRIRPLMRASLKLDGDLSQWNASQTRQSKFTVDASRPSPELQIHGGSGQLETKQQFADFIFSMQCRTGGSGMNGGVFFRCIPGDYMNGYESQIHNQFMDGDRTKPVDCGTGGIFRRVNARLVNAEDEAWFSKTIIACGPNISIWVNGLQVTDWTDRRKPDPNPRKGLRLEAGSIIFQGHDPATDIRIRELKVQELNKRTR
jgi:hypothetical protein